MLELKNISFKVNTDLGEKTIIDSRQADKFTCEIDDTRTMAEAINTFLTINR